MSDIQDAQRMHKGQVQASLMSGGWGELKSGLPIEKIHTIQLCPPVEERHTNTTIHSLNAEEPSSFPSTHTSQLTVTSNSSSRVLDAPFWSPRAPSLTCTYPHMDTHTYGSQRMLGTLFYHSSLSSPFRLCAEVSHPAGVGSGRLSSAQVHRLDSQSPYPMPFLTSLRQALPLN